MGADKVVLQTEPLTGSEDFANMLQAIAGSYLFIGNGDAASGGHGACMVHNPNYDFDDRNIPVGAAFRVHLAERFLGSATFRIRIGSDRVTQPARIAPLERFLLVENHRFSTLATTHQERPCRTLRLPSFRI